MTIAAKIDWQPISNMPEDRKDGRMMLLWSHGPEIGRWSDESPFSEDGGWEEQQELMPITHPTHWADINPPEPS